MKFLVTGVHGQVGSAFERLAKQRGMEVVSVSREQWDIATSPHFGQQLVAAIKPDVVVNSAAFTNVDGAEENKEIALKVNAQGPRSLARGCSCLNIPMIQISTDYVFNGEKECPYNEEDITCPINIYGETKLLGEIAVKEETQQHIIIRTSWVFSEHGKNFVNSIRDKIQNGNELRVVNDQYGGPTSANSIANAVLNISERIGGNNGIYHYAGQPFVSWFELAAEIEKLGRARGYYRGSGSIVACSSSEFPRKAKRPSNSALDSKKAQRDFGLEPCDWRAELQEFFDEKNFLPQTQC